MPDYDAALRFYVGTLGFALEEDTPLEGTRRWVVVSPGRGGASIVLARAATPAQREAIGRGGGGRVWLFLQTDDFARDHAAMLAAGVVFEETPRRESYGTVAVWRDPFGNRWDLIEPSSAPFASTDGEA